MFRFRHRQSIHPRIEQIRQLSLFAMLAPRELAIVDGQLLERRYVKGEIVFDEGDEGLGLYIVLDGKVLICKQGAPETGRISEVTAGHAFGELALIDGAPRSAQARAAEDCTLALLSRSDFNGLLDMHARIGSKIAMQLARTLGGKLREHFIAMDARPL